MGQGGISKHTRGHITPSPGQHWKTCATHMGLSSIGTPHSRITRYRLRLMADSPKPGNILALVNSPRDKHKQLHCCHKQYSEQKQRGLQNEKADGHTAHFESQPRLHRPLHTFINATSILAQLKTARQRQSCDKKKKYYKTRSSTKGRTFLAHSVYTLKHARTLLFKLVTPYIAPSCQPPITSSRQWNFTKITQHYGRHRTP